MPRPPDAQQLTWDEIVEQLGGSLWVVQGAGEARQSGQGGGVQQSPDGVTVERSFRATVSQGEFHDVYVSTETSSRQEREAILDWRLLNSWVGVGTPQPPVIFPIEMRAERWEGAVEVSGTMVQFCFVGQPHAWAAAGMVGEHQVFITARSWPANEVRLVRAVVPSRVEPFPRR